MGRRDISSEIVRLGSKMERKAVIIKVMIMRPTWMVIIFRKL